MKSIRILAVIAAGWLGAFSVSSANSSQLIGFMTMNQEWLDSSTPTAAYGFYGINSSEYSGFSPMSPTGPDNTWANCGSTLIDGKHYCYDVRGTWMNYTLSYRVFDASTWGLVKSSSFTYQYSQSSSEASLKAKNIPCGLAYDPVDDTLWAVTHAFSNTESVKLCRVDIESGELIPVADLPAIRNAACDSHGNLYGIGLDSKLYSIAKDGSCTAIGETGYWPTRDPEIKTGAAINFRDGMFYWSLFGFSSEEDRNYNRNGISGLLKIDPTTAEAQLLYSYPADQRFSSLAVANAHPMAPDDITDLSYTADYPDYTSGTLTFTVPTTTYDQSPMTGEIGMSVALDGTPVIEKNVNPGDRISETLTGLSEGSHNLIVTLSANGYTGSPAATNIFVGPYTPSNVSELTLTYDKESGSAVLNWETPADANGNAAPTSDLRYKIVRNPGGVIVARSAKGNSFTEKADFPWAYYHYTITPYAGGYTAGTTKSNSLKMGAPMSLPFDESFNTRSSLDAFTLIDANGDGNGGDWDTPEWIYDDEYYCAFYYGKRDVTADDWLITPSLKLEEGTVYKLTFKYYAYYGYGSKFRVAVGSEPTVDDMDFEVLYKETVSSFSDRPGITQTVYFAPREGDHFIGFHHISETMEHLSIDDIHVEAYCSAEIPAAVENLTALKKSDTEVQLTFDLPTVSAGRTPVQGPLTVNIYKNGAAEPCATLTDKNPGEKISWTDNSVSQSVHSYRVVASNSVGDGYDAETSIDMRKGEPVAVKSLQATLINPNQVYLEWPASVASVDDSGRPIDLENLRYLVYKPVPDEEGNTEYRLLGRDLKECHFIDNDPKSGLGDDLQALMYYVAPVNADAEGYATASNILTVGESRTLPYEESWPQQTMNNGPWFRTASYGATWYIRHKGYDPSADGLDGFGIATCETDLDKTFGSGGFLSPRLDLTLATSPVLTFYMYQGPEYQSGVQLAVGVDFGDGRQHLIPGAVYSARAEESGWKEITVPLSDYTSFSSVSIAFYGYVVPENSIHIDKVSVSGVANTSELALTAISGAAECRTGIASTFNLEIANKGSVTSGEFSVEMLADGRSVETRKVSALASGETRSVPFSFTPDEDSADRIVDLTFNMKDCDKSDTNKANNSLSHKVAVKEANSYSLSNLSGSINADNIELHWSVPEESAFPESFIDDVESYRSFSITGAGAWTVYDGDMAYNSIMMDGSGNRFEWENCHEKQAFIVFDNSNFSNAIFKAQSGNKFFAAWPASASSNDDWLISPELPGTAQLISFFARSIQQGNDAFEVLVSNAGNSPEEFTSITGAAPVSTTAEWTLYHFILPEGTRHFAIRYIGTDGQGMMIDDIMYYGTPLPEGYYIYRNGVRLNQTPLNALSYKDSDIRANESYVYNVAPVYNGIEMEKSDDFLVETSAIGSVSADSSIRVNAISGGIEISGAAGRKVRIHSVDGRCLATLTASDPHRIEIASGIYIVSVGEMKVKVAVR